MVRNSSRFKAHLESLRSKLPLASAMVPSDGVLMLISVLGPVLYGWMTGQAEHVRMAVFGAFQVSLVNVQGLYRDRSRTKLAALAILLTMLGWVNVIHGNRLLEISSMFVLMLIVGRAAAFSPTAVSLGMASSVAYIVMGAIYSHLGWSPELLGAARDLGLGGLWAVTAHYLYGALRPGTPLAQKVSEVYRTLALTAERNRLSASAPAPASLAQFEAVESALVQARSLWASSRNYRQGASSRQLQLLALIESSDNIRSQLRIVLEDLSHIWEHPLLEAVRPKLVEAWQELTTCLRDVPAAVSFQHRPLRLLKLERTLTELDEARESLRLTTLSSGDLVEDVDGLPVLLSLRVIVEALQRIAQELHLVDETARSLLPRPLIDRFWKTTPVSDWSFGGHRRKAIGIRSLRSLKSFTSLDRHAVRFASIVVVGSQVGQLPIFDHGYWVPLHIALVLKPDYGSTAERSLERTSGTVWGSILGMALIAAGINAKILWFILLFLLFSALTVRPARYSWFVGLITPAVVLMFELTSHQGWTVGLDRILSTVAGVTIALLGVALIFPKWERTGLPQLLETAILSYRSLFRKVVKSYIDPSLPPVAERAGTLRFQTTSDTANLDAAIKRMLREPQRLHLPKEQLVALVPRLYRLASSIAALAYYQEQFNWRYHIPEFAEYCEEVSAVMAELACSAKESRPPQRPHQLEPILEKIRLKVQQVQRERAVEYAHQPSRETELAKAVREQTPVFTQLERIARGLDRLGANLTLLNTPRNV